MFYTYILLLSNGMYYHGYSDNLKQRVAEHQNGKVFTTKTKRPIKLMFYAGFMDKKRALDFEKYLKSSSGHAFRNKRLV